MDKLTRKRWNAYTDGLLAANEAEDVAKTFNVTPSAQQKLENKVQESNDFLSRINVVPVRDMLGEKLGLGVSGPIASRTNTQTKDRQTTDISTLDGRKYLCVKTDYDTHLPYAKLDMWAKFPDFAKRISAMRFQRCGLDRQMVGFNGLAAAAETDKATNPMLQDVNIGWLESLRQEAAERVLKEVVAASGKIKVGGVGADYHSLDGLVYDAFKTLLDPWHTEAGDLIAICGRNMLHDKLFPLVDKQDAPTEQLAASIITSQARLGKLQAVTVPYMPDGAILVTSYSNLSIYYQESARRMHVIENPKRDRIETYESSNDAFVIEDLGKACLIENIELQP